MSFVVKSSRPDLNGFRLPVFPQNLLAPSSPLPFLLHGNRGFASLAAA